MNVDGILAETRRKTLVILFINSRFINDSDEFAKMFERKEHFLTRFYFNRKSYIVLILQLIKLG